LFLPLAALILLAAGCDAPVLPGTPNPANRPVPEDQVLDFDALYQRNCAGCHGQNGTLGPAPPLNDALFLAIVPDDVLQNVITSGRPGTPMAGFAPSHGGPLTAAQVEVLAKGLKTHWGATDQPRSNTTPPYLIEPTEPSEADRQAGAAVYATACAGCHGKQGEGGDTAGAINDQAFLQLISDQALRRLIITGRPDLGMPDYAGADGRPAEFKPLTAAEVDQLSALLAGWRSAAVEDAKP
jgi:cytochrome c oxidase cbb3-type subunit III